MDLGYARVSTTKQDLERQLLALEAAGIPPERIYVDRKTGVTTDPPDCRRPWPTPATATSSWSTPWTASGAPCATP